MSNKTDNLSLSETEDPHSRKLSPIVEIDESRIFGDGGNLDITLEVLQENITVQEKIPLAANEENDPGRSSQPGTPPEVLRQRLNILQTDYNELREFTELEKQIYHSDCTPNNKVKSLEEEFKSLNEKVEHLIQENLEYKSKLEQMQDSKALLECELADARHFQTESLRVIVKIKQRLKENVKNAPTSHENDPLPLSLLDHLNEGVASQNIDSIISSLQALPNLVENLVTEKNENQGRADNLQSQITVLNEVIEQLKTKTTEYEQSLFLEKSSTVILQERLNGINKELSELSKAFSVSEKKCNDAEIAKEVINQSNYKLQNEMNNIEKDVDLILNELKSFIKCLDVTSERKRKIDKDDILVGIKNDLHKSLNLFSKLFISSAFEQTLYNLKKKIRDQEEECINLRLIIKNLNYQTVNIEEQTNSFRIELQALKNQVNDQLMTRLSAVEECLIISQNNNTILQNQLLEENLKVKQLLNEISDSSNRIGELKSCLNETFIEKNHLEDELLKLNGRLTVDKVQSHIVLALKELTCIINSWNGNLDITDLFNNIMQNTHICNTIDLLMDFQTKTMFNEVVMHSKMKISLNSEKPSLKRQIKKLMVDIERFENENNHLRSEVTTIDQEVRGKMNKRINHLEKLIFLSDSEKQSEDKLTLLKQENEGNISDCIKQKEGMNFLQGSNNDCHKYQKDMNNFNKATKVDQELNRIPYVLKEIENIVDSWDFSKEMLNNILQLDNMLLEVPESFQKPSVHLDLFHIINKFKTKLIEFAKRSHVLHQSEKDYENKNVMYNNSIGDLKYKTNVSKGEHMFAKCCVEKEEDWEKREEIEAIKRLMVREVTSLNEDEDKESLMCESVESIFTKLMEIIMRKEREMSQSIRNQVKAEGEDLEHTVEKLNNKLKSQESWINAVETENERLNIELSDMKALNNSAENKLKGLSNEVKSKNMEIGIFTNKITELTTQNGTLLYELDRTNELVSNEVKSKSMEIGILKNKIAELTTQNGILLNDLDKTKELVLNYKHSTISLENDVKILHEEIVKKTNIITDLNYKLSRFVGDKKEEVMLDEMYTSSNGLLYNGKGDFMKFSANQISENVNVPVNINNSTYGLKCGEGHHVELETCLAQQLKKEIALINDMVKVSDKKVLSELFLRCSEKLEILKDITQIVGSKVTELEMCHVNKLESMEKTLECKSKELHDLKLSLSTLYMDFAHEKNNVELHRIIDESFQKHSINSLQYEIEQVKEEFVKFTNKVEDLEHSAKMGQYIIHHIREQFQIILEDNNKMRTIIDDFRKSEKELKLRCGELSKEVNKLQEKSYVLKSEIRSLKLKQSEIKTDVLSEIVIDFPDNIQKNCEKVSYINNILKKYLEYQNICDNVTENLIFFRSQCEFMLSYIGTVEYKLYFAIQQKQQLEKEINLLKGKVSSQNLEINRFVNQLISKSPFAITSLSHALDVIGHIFSENKLLKENEVKYILENKCTQEKILKQQKEMDSLAKLNSSLTVELSKCEEWIRNLRSELRTIRSHCQRRESNFMKVSEEKEENVDVGIQTEPTCCKIFEKKIMEQKEKIDSLSVKLNKSERLQKSTCNPYNKQVTYLEEALSQAKEKIGRLNFTLKEQEGFNHDLIENQQQYQQKLEAAYKEIETLRSRHTPS